METMKVKFTKRSVADTVRLAKIKSRTSGAIGKVFAYISGGKIHFEVLQQDVEQSEKEVLVDITTTVNEYLTGKTNMKKATDVAYEKVVETLNEKSIIAVAL